MNNSISMAAAAIRKMTEAAWRLARSVASVVARCSSPMAPFLVATEYQHHRETGEPRPAGSKLARKAANGQVGMARIR